MGSFAGTVTDAAAVVMPLPRPPPPMAFLSITPTVSSPSLMSSARATMEISCAVCQFALVKVNCAPLVSESPVGPQVTVASLPATTASPVKVTVK